MDEIFMPVLSHFQNGNPWLSSAGRLRFRILPAAPEEGEGTLTVEVWEGPWAYEFSTVEESETFPLTEEGIAAIPHYLETWRQEVEARPQRTLEENIARRREPEKPAEPKE